MLIPEKVVLYALSPLNWDFPILEVDIKDAMEKHEKQWNEIKSQIQTAKCAIVKVVDDREWKWVSDLQWKAAGASCCSFSLREVYDNDHGGYCLSIPLI